MPDRDDLEQTWQHNEAKLNRRSIGRLDRVRHANRFKHTRKGNNRRMGLDLRCENLRRFPFAESSKASDFCLADPVYDAVG
jgi:hypothetical protein